jgi:hypothetical protein
MLLKNVDVDGLKIREAGNESVEMRNRRPFTQVSVKSLTCVHKPQVHEGRW